MRRAKSCEIQTDDCDCTMEEITEKLENDTDCEEVNEEAGKRMVQKTLEDKE